MPSPRLAASSFLFHLLCMLVATAAFGMRTGQVLASLLFAAALTGVHLVARVVVGRRADLPAAAFAATTAGYLLLARLGGHDPLNQDGAAVAVGLVAVVLVLGARAARPSG